MNKYFFIRYLPALCFITYDDILQRKPISFQKKFVCDSLGLIFTCKLHKKRIDMSTIVCGNGVCLPILSQL